jgi:hypothetical protein
MNLNKLYKNSFTINIGKNIQLRAIYSYDYECDIRLE